MSKGKLLVIEGTDGSGKATQTKLLRDRLAAEGFNSGTMSFPKYEGNVFGELIGECLSGGRGDYLSLHPRITATLYAGDRFESKDFLNKLLEDNDVVVLDRYVSSNQIHQGGRLKDGESIEDFLEWLDNLEFNLFGLPRPDLVFFLDVPPEVSMKLAQRSKNSGDKEYLNGSKDVYEESLDYNKRSYNNAVVLLDMYKDWERIRCVEGDEMRTPEDIHSDVWEQTSRIIS